MRSYFCRLVLCALLCFGMPTICFCQGTAGWTVKTEPNSVKLVSVEKEAFPGPWKFTFQNVSGKTIIFFGVDDLHGTQAGLDAFVLGGVGAVAPGATTSVVFDSRNFPRGVKNANTLRVDAIFYADGSAAGPWKARMEDGMLGEALETKRDADLLSASPDPSISGFDNVAAQIRSQPLHSREEAVQSVSGVTLPGVSQAYINRHLAHPSFSFRAGVHDARSAILNDIAVAKSNDARAMAGSKAAQQWELARRPHALSDFAKKRALRSKWQAQYIKALERREL